MTNPKISIVVPFSKRGEFLAETLRSLVDQDYRPVEVIVQTGGPDRSNEVAKSFMERFPEVFRLFTGPEGGLAQGLNLGFEKATGEILGFLHADDTLLPGCLRRVAVEIRPEDERYVVMGRCFFTVPDAPYAGIEYPCEYVDHFHHLAFWKRGINTIPQPSVFWHRSVWEKCGGFDGCQQQVLDYELFLRFSKYYHFHRVDEFWSTYRIDPENRTLARSEREIFDLSLRASRSHWGPWWSLLRWRCELSFWLHNPRRFEIARHHARLVKEALRRKARWKALKHAACTFLHSPTLAWNRLAVQFLHFFLFPVAEAVLLRPRPCPKEATPRYGDDWIGPNFAEKIQVPNNAKRLVLCLQFIRPRALKTRIDIRVEGRKLWSLTRRNSDTLNVYLNVEQYRGKLVTLQILSSTFFTPSYYTGEDDHRWLSMRIQGLRFD